MNISITRKLKKVFSNKKWLTYLFIVLCVLFSYFIYRDYLYYLVSKNTKKIIEKSSITPGSKTVMITGGSSGIGYAYSSSLLELGYRVAIVSKSTAIIKAKELASKYPQFADNVKGIIADVRDEKSMEKAFKEASAFSPTGVLDAIILNAGIDGEIFKDDENIIQTNLLGPIYGIQLYVNQITDNLSRPADKEKGYQIIVTGSLSSFVPVDMNLSPAYDASKAGIAQYVRGMRPFAVRYNFRINAVCPAGMVYTNLTAPFIDSPEKKAGAYLYQNTEGRGGIMMPEQIVPGMLDVLTTTSYNGDMIAVQANLGFLHRLEPRDEKKAFVEYGKYDERESYPTKKFIDYTIFSEYMKNDISNPAKKT
jgi:NAD(P)-dependent dehydrogenase (short-subunit alcohol dehydrogenase family)